MKQKRESKTTCHYPPQKKKHGKSSSYESPVRYAFGCRKILVATFICSMATINSIHQHLIWCNAIIQFSPLPLCNVYVCLRVYFRNLQCQVPSHAEHYVETVEIILFFSIALFMLETLAERLN